MLYGIDIAKIGRERKPIEDVLTGFPNMPWKLESFTSFPFCSMKGFQSQSCAIAFQSCDVADGMLAQDIFAVIIRT